MDPTRAAPTRSAVSLNSQSGSGNPRERTGTRWGGGVDALVRAKSRRTMARRKVQLRRDALNKSQLERWRGQRANVRLSTFKANIWNLRTNLRTGYERRGA